MKNLLLLLPLPVIAGWVAFSGLTYRGEEINPALFNNAGSVTQPPEIKGMEPRGRPRLYTADNLYEYVNGHAEFFISSGFSRLTVYEYKAASGAGELTLEVYDMKTPENAGGVLAQERGSAEPVEGIGRQGFSTRGLILFRKGRYYMKATGFNIKDDELASAARKAANAIEAAKSDRGKELLPSIGLKEGSRGFVKSDYLALEFLKDVKTATYLFNGGEAEGFLLPYGPQELLDFFRKEGSQVNKIKISELDGWLIDDRYEGKISLVTNGKQTIGLKGNPGKKNIESFLTRGADNLKGR